MLLASNDFFAFDVPQGAATLIGRVRRTLSEVEVTQVCEWFLEAAEPGRNQYWLLDVRQDTEPKSPALTQWLDEQFLPRTVEVVGCSVYLAYLFEAALFEKMIENELLDQWHTSTPNCYLGFFAEESAALAWLAREWEADSQPSALPLSGM